MISKKKFNTIQELQALQRLATSSSADIGLHSEDDQTIVDAKSYIGMYTLDFSKPILVVSEDAFFHAQIKDIGENIE